MSGLLPDEIVNRRKQGFGAPVSEWFRGDLGYALRRRSGARRWPSEDCSTTSVIDELWAAHRAGRANWAFQLWNLYNVSAWHDQWVAGRALV